MQAGIYRPLWTLVWLLGGAMALIMISRMGRWNTEMREGLELSTKYQAKYARFEEDRRVEDTAASTSSAWKGSAVEVDAPLDMKELPFNRSSTVKSKFRVIVLTMNRSTSLQRLLESINSANFMEDEITLDIWIDRSKKGDIDQLVLDTCRKFDFRHGRKVIYKRAENAGLLRQWTTTWTPSDAGENVVLLEDDLEVSPFFYVWLKRARQQYGHIPEVASFTLQRAGILASNYEGSLKIKVPSQFPVFFYKLVGSWGHSPNRSHWKDFTKFFREKAWDKSFKPYVNGLVMTDWYKAQEGKGTMWTMYYIWWCEHNNYYNGYANLPSERTLASNWQEGGLHYKQKETAKADFPVLTHQDATQFSFPRDPIKINWFGYVVGGGGNPAIIGKHINKLYKDRVPDKKG